MAEASLRFPIANSQACLIISISREFDITEKPRCHVLLELRLAQRGSVGLKNVSIRVFTLTFRRKTYSNKNELGLAAAESLEGAAVAQDDLARLDDEGKLFTTSVTAPWAELEAGDANLSTNGLGFGLGLLGGHCD